MIYSLTLVFIDEILVRKQTGIRKVVSSISKIDTPSIAIKGLISKKRSQP
jgi:hypothetical protein